MKKIQFTKEGYQQLVEELEDLKKNKYPASIIRLQKARAMGDLAENSEYHAAKEDMAFFHGRISEVEQLIKLAEIVEATTSNDIQMGVVVTVERDGKEETYSIVGEFEADPMLKKLSATSPIGRALLGKKEGETVEVEVPAGKLRYKIVKISK